MEAFGRKEEEEDEEEEEEREREEEEGGVGEGGKGGGGGGRPLHSGKDWKYSEFSRLVTKLAAFMSTVQNPVFISRFKS